MTPTTGQDSAAAEIYFTAMDRPNQVLTLASLNFAAAASSGPRVAAVAGSGTTGSLGDGGAATAAELDLKLDSPYMRSGVAIAADGTMFIADTRNATIRRIAGPVASDAAVIRSVAGKWGPQQNVHLVEPMGIALDRVGNLYIADPGANAVLVLHDATAATPGRLEVLAHVEQAALVTVTGDGKHVFVAAPETVAALNIDARTREIWKVFIGGKSAPPSPTAAASAAGSVCKSTASGTQPCPSGIAVDGRSNLFVADPTGDKIVRIDAVSGRVTTAATDISAPGEIAFDASGNLFIAEQGRNRIIEIKGLGQPVSNVTLTPPPAPVPPAGVPCPAIAPPLGFVTNTNFCAEPLAGTTPTAAFTVTNNTNADLTSLSWTTLGINPADFIVVSTSCTPTLHAGSSCTLNVGFAPTAAGPRTATLVVTYAGTAPPLVSALAGTGEDYQITLASGQLTEISVLAGDAGTFNLQVVPDNIFTGTVNFVCPGNMPAATTCSFSPGNSVNVTVPGTPVPFSVSFQTSPRKATKNLTVGGPASGTPGRSGPATSQRKRLNPALILSVGVPALVLFILFAFAFAVPRRRSQVLRLASTFALLVSFAAILDGCHSNDVTGTTGTPVGSSKMTVQGATQGASRGITVTLDVE
ncbi:MAG: choice-of-anchor D domain-containing protein [Candidatus Acidiferrales bacterium]